MANNEDKAIEIKQSFEQLGTIKKQFNAEQIKFIMSTIAPSLNEQETWLFLLKCQMTGFNPLNGEIFAYSSTKDGVRKLVIIPARDGKRNKAQATGKLEYIKTEAIYIKEVENKVQKFNSKGEELQPEITKIKIKVEPWDGTLWGAETTVKRTDRNEPTIVRVPLSEYKQTNAIWSMKPETQIKKVSQSQALSEAFPELSGLYDEAEMWDEPKVVTPEVTDGEEPATVELLKTIKAMGGDSEKEYTKQEAVNEIARLRAVKKESKGK